MADEGGQREEGEGGRDDDDTAKGERARWKSRDNGREKIDILIGQNNWNERTNGRS